MIIQQQNRCSGRPNDDNDVERDDVKIVKAVTIMIHCTAYNDGNYLR